MTTATIMAPTTVPPRLFEVLEQEATLSEELLALLDQEQATLVAMEVQALVALTRRKTNLLTRIQAADALLQEMVGQLLAGTAGKANLTGVINGLARGEERERLAATRQRLLRLREQIVAKNTINRHFAEDTQRYLNDAISLITSAAAENQDSYQRGRGNGRKPPSANRPALISRAV